VTVVIVYFTYNILQISPFAQATRDKVVTIGAQKGTRNAEAETNLGARSNCSSIDSKTSKLQIQTSLSSSIP
jgi:hypothetical protein